MLTNLETIQTRVDRLKKLRSDSAEDKLVGTKKEKADLEREMEKLANIFDGISEMKTLPSVVFVTDILKDDIAISEANKLGIATVAICDTNTNPQLITYPIAANDDAVRTISLITTRIADATKRGSELYRAKTDEAAAQELAKTVAEAASVAEAKADAEAAATNEAEAVAGTKPEAKE